MALPEAAAARLRSILTMQLRLASQLSDLSARHAEHFRSAGGVGL